MRVFEQDKHPDGNRRFAIRNPWSHTEDGLAQPTIEEIEEAPAEPSVLSEHQLVHAASKGRTSSSPRPPRKAKR